MGLKQDLSNIDTVIFTNNSERKMVKKFLRSTGRGDSLGEFLMPQMQGLIDESKKWFLLEYQKSKPEPTIDEMLTVIGE